jgi:hypothetical protein
MFTHENALLVGGSYFFVTLLVLPGIVGWWYQNYIDQKGVKSTPRVMPISGHFKTPHRAA